MENQFFEGLKAGTIILGIITLLLAAIFLVSAVKSSKSGKKKKRLFTVLAVFITAFCLVTVAGLSYAASVFSNSIDIMMSLWGRGRGRYGKLERTCGKNCGGWYGAHEKRGQRSSSF